MAGKWQAYWNSQLQQIERGLSEWRQGGFARVPLMNLKDVSSRGDLYGASVTVASYGPIKGGGQRHRLELALVIAQLLEKGEIVRVRIRGGESSADYLEFSAG
jgi:hypothetical protein